MLTGLLFLGRLSLSKIHSLLVHSQNKEDLPIFRMLMYMLGQTVGALFFSVTLIR